MKIKIINDGKCTWIVPRQLKNSLDVEDLQQAVMDRIACDGLTVGIDFSELRLFNIYGLGRMIELLLKASLNSKELLLNCENTGIRNIFQKFGVTEYWQLEEQALTVRSTWNVS